MFSRLVFWIRYFFLFSKPPIYLNLPAFFLLPNMKGKKVKGGRFGRPRVTSPRKSWSIPRLRDSQVTFIITSLEGKPSNKKSQIGPNWVEQPRSLWLLCFLLSIEKHQQTRNTLQNKGFVILAVLSTDAAGKNTCSYVVVSSGPPTVYLGHVLKQTLEATSYSPKHISASGSDKREKILVEWNLNFEFGWISIRPSKMPRKNGSLSSVICFRKKKNFKHGDGRLHLLTSTKKGWGHPNVAKYGICT